jgi:hypothetical protein
MKKTFGFRSFSVFRISEKRLCTCNNVGDGGIWEYEDGETKNTLSFKETSLKT